MIDKKIIIEKETGWNLENSYARLPGMLFTIRNPIPIYSPKLIIFNDKLAEELGLNSNVLKSNDGIEILSGNKVPEGSVPIAQAYAGHQFGHFTMLGDGRAMLVGEQITPLGKKVDIQLKGSGRTPYSRGGDGRAALGPMLREYIISEAMHALDIPTTRSLSVVTTGESIIREQVQDGAILTRVAASHIRVGTFQYIAKYGVVEELKELADYTIQRHFPDAYSKENPYLFLLKEVIKRQAELIAKWQLVGFIHGVMNTDNMAISGETIDYGPCAFMDVYDNATVFSSIDIQGRYAYGNQPNIAGWNLARFAETLIPIIHENPDEALRLAQDEISNFKDLYHYNLISGMRGKLGIFNEELEDEALIEELLSIMHKYRADYTNTFRLLTLDKLDDSEIFKTTEFIKWYELWQGRLERQDETKVDSKKLMQSCNPAIIPRNHRVEEAIEAAVKEGDYSVMDRLLNVLSNPYDYSSEQDEYSTLPKEPNNSYRTYCGT